MTLKYSGFGFLVGVPARDMTEKEAERFGGVSRLVATGLYSLEGETMPAPDPVLPIRKTKKQDKKEGE
jgi:hypothetical protein